MEIIRDISSALDYLKGQNVVHYDIKPRNIAYSSNRGAVLLDFGLSSAPVNKICGTRGYLPPETFNDRPRDFAGDIWALGITTLYIRGYINQPETSVNGSLRFATMHYEHRRWWESCLFPVLRKLEDRTVETEEEYGLCSLVVSMLREDIEARVGAAKLLVAAQDLLNSVVP